MTKEELDRIKKAYSSGLKVQIWFNGYWEDFDIRDYSMYSEPFSENRQYRIVGSDYADIAESQIADLQKKYELLSERCNQLLKDKGYLTDKIADIKANCDLAIEGRDVKIAELEEQIEEMKCCGNCLHRHYWGNELGCNLDLDKQFECDNNKKKYWEFKKE